MQERCPDCERLWQEYARATNRHIQLTGKLRIAQLEGDRGKAADLSAEVNEAEKARDAAREAIRKHESSNHPPEPGLEASAQPER